MSKHTPGPWKFYIYCGDVHVGKEDESYAIAKLFSHGENIYENARIMAAAPELLAFIEKCLNSLNLDTSYDLTEEARALVKKAKEEK